ncbi:MAG: PKD domain-containing protein, partial [Candidatus Latescibacteria bacterium]|nr:PKD domain-containing protein [Candidatus Latescibacterota bacterium]
PFDYAPYDGPARAVESKLGENRIIGLSWSILDYDENKSVYEGFWNLSQKTRMDSNASCQVAFRLMPLEKQFRKPIEAEWSFKVVDMDRRLVAFKDMSYGDITSWRWEFDDGTTSTEQNPIHRYEKAGDFVVVLTVKGPAGTARRIKVRDVAVR